MEYMQLRDALTQLVPIFQNQGYEWTRDHYAGEMYASSLNSRREVRELRIYGTYRKRIDADHFYYVTCMDINEKIESPFVVGLAKTIVRLMPNVDLPELLNKTDTKPVHTDKVPNVGLLEFLDKVGTEPVHEFFAGLQRGNPPSSLYDFVPTPQG